MKTVKFEDDNGREYYINPDNVDIVEKAEFNGTDIHLIGGEWKKSNEDIDVVLKKLQGD